jgi:hypothetical protein
MLLLDKVFRHLKKTVRLPFPVSYRRRTISDDDGFCTFKDDHFAIMIKDDLPEWFAVEVLLHEYAHALAWGRDEDQHGYNWGMAYSVVYRTFLDFYRMADWEQFHELTRARIENRLLQTSPGEPPDSAVRQQTPCLDR